MGSNEMTPEVIRQWNEVKNQFQSSASYSQRMPTQEEVVAWLEKIGKFALASLVGALSAAAFKKLMGW